jgi:LuxR family maltose regulon positive regulatory protein
MEAPTVHEWPLGSVVAVTKLHVPDGRSGLVPRPALVDALVGARDVRLTLVTGPAGAGKTTLLAQWHEAEAESRPFAWLSLDPEDADPVRFWGCVIEALRTVAPGFGAQAANRLRAGRAALVDAVVPLLINEAAALPSPIVLVLDDLHALGDAEDVHRSLGFLVDRLPPALHVAIATRSEPPLPVGRLRARRQLFEVRAADLRFTDADAADLLRRGFGIELDAGQIGQLRARTEGWAAGLQLAGLSLGRRGADFAGFMAAFGGADADVVSYLGAEVLEAQTPQLRDFLLRTSILERLSAPLCEAITDRPDAGRCLDELERRNLLLMPLDAQRRWWRYHQLFAELLRHELARTLPEREIGELHRRAAAWHRLHGAPSDAIRHALAGGDPESAAMLVAEHWESTFNGGELATVARWLEQLPAEALQREPRLWLARLWTAMDQGRLDDAQRQLAEATAAPEARAWGRVLHALHAFKRGDLAQARRGIERGDGPPVDDDFLRTVEMHVRGLVAYWTGARAAAHRCFGRAAELAERDGNVLGLVYALGYLALIAAEGGDREGVAARLAQVQRLREDDEAVGEHFVAAIALLAEGRMLEASGAYEAAAPVLERAVALGERGAGRLEIADALLSLAAVQRARGRRDQARALVLEARRQADGCAEPGRVAAHLASLEHELLRPDDAEAAAGAPAQALSDSELAVLRLLPTALSQRELGEELYISVNTVKTHCRNIYAKLRVGSREQAVGRARELGLL